MTDNERQAVELLRKPCVDCDGVFESPRWQKDIADTIERLAEIADAAEGLRKAIHNPTKDEYIRAVYALDDALTKRKEV